MKIAYITNSNLRLVPLQELSVRDQQKVTMIFGYPCELQHKDNSKKSDSCGGKDNQSKLFASDNQYLHQNSEVRISQKENLSKFAIPLLKSVYAQLHEDKQDRQSFLKEFLKVVNQHRSRIGVRLMTHNQAYEATQYFEKFVIKDFGN